GLLHTLCNRNLATAVQDCRANTADTRDEKGAINVTAAAAIVELSLPSRLGRYEGRECLGGGAMGLVYKAHDPELDRDVAIKVPRFNGPAAAQVQAQARFRREARAAAAVRHPHVCPIHDVGDLDGVPYAVMAFIEGMSLAELAAAERIEPRRAAEIVH